MKPTPPVLWFKAASPLRAPSPWWYWGRAVYVSRRDYGRIFLVFLAVGVPLGGAGVLRGSATLLRLAFGLAALGLALLAYSLVGLYRMYGHPSPTCTLGHTERRSRSRRYTRRHTSPLSTAGTSTDLPPSPPLRTCARLSRRRRSSRASARCARSG